MDSSEKPPDKNTQQLAFADRIGRKHVWQRNIPGDEYRTGMTPKADDAYDPHSKKKSKRADYECEFFVSSAVSNLKIFYVMSRE